MNVSSRHGTSTLGQLVSGCATGSMWNSSFAGQVIFKYLARILPPKAAVQDDSLCILGVVHDKQHKHPHANPFMDIFTNQTVDIGCVNISSTLPIKGISRTELIVFVDVNIIFLTPTVFE